MKEVFTFADGQSRQPYGVRFFYGYVIVLACFIIAAAVEGAWFSFGIFFKPLLTEFGWTRVIPAGAFSLNSALHLCVMVVAGRLTDRFGPRLVLTACGFLLGLSYLLMSQTSTAWQLYLFYGVVGGVGMGFYWVPVISTVPRWFVKRRALMMGIFISGIGVGQLVMAPVANWLISTYGWRTSCLVIGSMLMGTIITSAQFLRLDPHQMKLPAYGESEAEQKSPVMGARGFSLSQAVRVRQFWTYCVIGVSFGFCFSVALVHSVIHGIGLGMTGAGAANILVIIGITGIMGRLVFGRLADVIGMKPVLVGSFVLMSVAFSCLAMGSEVWVVYLFAAIYGTSYVVFEILMSPIVAELFGLSSLGAIMGVAAAIGGVGLIAGSAVAGHIFDTNGSYQVAFLMCAAMAIIASILTVPLPLTGRTTEVKPGGRGA